MKASFKILLVALMTTVANVALAKVDRANDEKSAKVQAQIFSTNNDMVFVQLEMAGNGKVMIQISDEKGNVLHTESIKEETKILKRFDISNLPAGPYFYKVESEFYSLKKKIEKK